MNDTGAAGIGPKSSDTGANPPVQSAQARLISVQQIELLLGHMPLIIWGSLLVYFILYLWLVDRADSSIINWTLGLMIVLSIARTAVLVAYIKKKTTVDNVKSRLPVLYTFSVLAGTLWGVFGYVSVSESDLIVSVIVIMVLTGMVASATASLSVLLPAFALYVLPSMLPAAYKFTTFSEPKYFWIGVLICIYLIASIHFARGINKSIINGIKLRFENLKLVDSLTEQKARAEKAQADAEHSNHAKSRFLAAASHDLRQPLHALRLLTATLDVNTSNDKQKHIVSRMDHSVKSLEGLFDSLLDISRLDAGTVKVEIEHFNLQSVLDAIGNAFADVALEQHLELKVEPSDHIVRTDRMLLERVLMNLTSNAIRYSNSGSITIKSELVEIQQTGPRIVLSVTDTGVGIADKDRERIFDEFVQLENPERDRSKGLGLGLSIVRRITDLLEIDLGLESQPGTGTTVTLLLPVGEIESISSNRDTHAIIRDSLEDILVVIIDDEEDVRVALRGLLEEWGCHVLNASGADEAKEKLADLETVPDVIIADYRLRAHTLGTDAIDSLHEFYNQSIPALIVTGDVAQDRLSEINARGFPVLHKPCEPGILYSYLYRLTNKLY